MKILLVIIFIVIVLTFVIGIFCMCFLEDVLEYLAIKKLKKLLIQRKLGDTSDKYYKDLSNVVNRIIVWDALYNIKVRKSKWNKGWFVRSNRYRNISGNEKGPCSEYVYFPSDGVINSCGERYRPKYYLSNKEEAIELQRRILESQLDYILSIRTDIFSED